MKDTIIEAVKNSIDKGWKEGKEWLDHLDNFEEGMLEIIIPAIVFDHKFAKARWGEGYKTHLQKMVLDEYPLVYLVRNPSSGIILS